MADRADMSFYDPEKRELGVSTKPEILDGTGAENLLEAKRKFLMKSGEIVVAGTDKGYDYLDKNEDRVAVDPNDNFVVVIDGMGAYGQGDKAAMALARNLLKQNQEVQKSADQAVRDMSAEMAGTEDGAVFISANIKTKLDDQKYLVVSQVGDARATVFNSKRGIKFRSVDDSIVGETVKIGGITKDQALYSPMRHFVGSAVGPKHAYVVKTYEIPLEEGDMVLLETDGSADNFTEEEYAEHIQDWTAEGIYNWIAENSQSRMVNRKEIEKATPNRKESGVYSDGFKSEPKRDNRAIAVFKVK